MEDQLEDISCCSRPARPSVGGRLVHGGARPMTRCPLIEGRRRESTDGALQKSGDRAQWCCNDAHGRYEACSRIIEYILIQL